MNIKKLITPYRLKAIAYCILHAFALFVCLFSILWILKCPHDLEWWRAACAGVLLVPLKRLL